MDVENARDSRSTRLSLLVQAQQGEEAAWRKLVILYQPLLRGWLTHEGVHPQEVEDLTQDILAALVRELPRFNHAGRKGAFRSWLRTITVNRAREFWRGGRLRPKGAGGDEFLSVLGQLEDENSLLSHSWDEEHDRHVVRGLLSLVAEEFEPSTVQAFHRLTFDDASGREVADELGLSLAAVYKAKSRVLERLREEAGHLLD